MKKEIIIIILLLLSNIVILQVNSEPTDEEINEPYIYWFAPENSFGIESTKTVNWSFFNDFFQDYIDWNLKYKRYIYSEWTDGNQYLTIEKTWNETGFWKFNLIFNAVVDIYSARFTLIVDKVVKNFYHRSGYETYLNFTIPNSNNEVYNLSLIHI